MAELNFDREELTLPCPKCGKDVVRTIGDLKAKGHAVCDTCGVAFPVDTSNFEKGVRAINDRLDKLFKGLGKQ